MLKKVISSVALTLIMSTNLIALDICPGEHYFTLEKVEGFNFPDESTRQFWQCLDSNNGAIYWDFQPGVQRFEWWTEYAGFSSCPKGTDHYGDFCLEPKTAKLPKFNNVSKPGEPEKGDAGAEPMCVNSFVIPKTREFHEDIEITGVKHTLHYASSRTADYIDGMGDYVVTDIANGWTLSNVHHFKAPYLYLGNGSVVKLEASQYTVNGNNEIILYNENHIGHQFDINGNIVRSFDSITGNTLFSFSYDSNGLLLGITDRFNLTTTIKRSKQGKALSIIAPHGEMTKLKVDRKNNLLSVQYEDRSAYTFKYDVGALMSQEKDPISNSFLHNFDSYGRLTSLTDAVDGTWEFYNTGDSTKGLILLTDPEGETSSFENFYPVNGTQTSKSISPTGDITTVTTTNDELEVTATTCGLSTKNVYTYDDITTQKRLASNTITTPNGLTSTRSMSREYIFNGVSTEEVIDTINFNGNTHTLTKDYTTHRETIASPENRNIEIEFDPISEQAVSLVQSGIEPILYSYNNEGNLLAQKQGERTQVYQYDERGNVASYTNSMGQTTNYAYDTLNRMTSIAHPNGYSTLFEYDANGNMLKLTTPTPSDYSFTYNGVDKRVSDISPLGNETQYNYDKKRRLINIHKASSKNIDYIYSDGRLNSIVRPEGTTNYVYGCGDLPINAAIGSKSIDYTYDGELLTNMHYSGILNQSISYMYNNDFLVSSMAYADGEESVLYDNDGLLVQRGNASITRNSRNGLVESIGEGSFTQNRSHNEYGEISASDDMVNMSTLYGYNIDKRDMNGKIIQKTEYIGSNQDVYTYRYDEMGRLSSVDKNGVATESYTYNVNGNRISDNISYTIEDQLEQVGDTIYAYDEDGYLASKVTPLGTTHYSYGTLGELHSVVTQEVTIEYLHNAHNQRVAKKVNGVITEKYLWADLTTLLAVYDGSDNLVQRFEYADQRMPYKMTYNGQKHYMHYDQVGTLKAVSSEDGTIIKIIEYDTFGNVLSDSNETFKVPFGFAGGLYDTDTKLTRFGYRDYDAQTGKWTAKDPIGFSGGDTNLYGYVLGDPVNFVDPEGLNPLIGVGLVAGAFVGGATAYATTPSGGNYFQNMVAGALAGALGGAALAVSGPLLGLTLDGIANSANVLNACK